MISQIISHTPTWVFALFFALVYIGVKQAQKQTVTLKRVVLLPIAMLGLSATGVWNTFNHSNTSLICWSAGLAASALIAFTLINVRDVRYIPEAQSFQLPGSWLPLCLMMAIFFTKFAVGIGSAHHPELLESTGFVATASIFNGLWSGAFVGRTLKIISSQSRNLTAHLFNA